MYTVKRKLLSIDVGADRRLKLSRLLAFCQELSIADTTRLNMGREKTLDKGLLWVIGKQRYIIHRLPEYDDEISLSSWPGETLRALFPRYYNILDKEGIAIEGVAIWSLINKKSRHYIFASDYQIDIPSEAYGSELPFPRKLIPPRLRNTAILDANYSNCDLNGHLNNASYIDFILGLIPISFIKKNEIKSLEIDYKKEIKLGQKVAVKYGRSGKDYWFYNEYFTMKLGFSNEKVDYLM